MGEVIRPSISLNAATPEHEVAYQEIVALMRRHESLPRADLLAIASNMVGKLLAMQDQRTMTTEMAMRIVSRNIEQGNRQAIVELMESKGSA